MENLLQRRNIGIRVQKTETLTGLNYRSLLWDVLNSGSKYIMNKIEYKISSRQTQNKFLLCRNTRDNLSIVNSSTL